MLKAIGVIAGIIAVAVAGILVYAATKPDVFRVQRSATIKAPPEKIFPLINDFRQWPAWSPYEQKDPAMKRTYSAPASGKGAVYEWDGNGSVGSGRITIVDATPPSLVQLNLDMRKPFEAHNIVEFTIERKGDATNVTWMMNGAVPYLAKIVHVFFDVDTMVGKDFDDGLASLKAAAEK
jgi:uncharacterized protein YndB with AHSA1/START domain